MHSLGIHENCTEAPWSPPSPPHPTPLSALLDVLPDFSTFYITPHTHTHTHTHTHIVLLRNLFYVSQIGLFGIPPPRNLRVCFGTHLV